MHPKCCLGHTYTTKLFIVYLKFKFNWASCILSGSPNSSPYCCDIAVFFFVGVHIFISGSLLFLHFPLPVVISVWMISSLFFLLKYLYICFWLC